MLLIQDSNSPQIFQKRSCLKGHPLNIVQENNNCSLCFTICSSMRCSLMDMYQYLLPIWIQSYEMPRLEIRRLEANLLSLFILLLLAKSRSGSRLLSFTKQSGDIRLFCKPLTTFNENVFYRSMLTFQKSFIFTKSVHVNYKTAYLVEEVKKREQ